MSNQAKLREWRRLRWYVLVVVIAGIGTSVTLNVEHAPDNWGAKLVAAVPPIAVFGIIEMVSRIPSTGWLLSTGRILASLAVSGVGAVISYTQQVAYVRGLGFSEAIADWFPVTIDGTMVVATLSLVEVVRRIRTVREEMDSVLTPVAARRAELDQLEDDRTREYRAAHDHLRRTGTVHVPSDGRALPVPANVATAG